MTTRIVREEGGEQDVCTCGHLRQVHDSLEMSEGIVLPDHGFCSTRGCACEMFTWKEFVVH
jgi:hypothetical protein